MSEFDTDREFRAITEDLALDIKGVHDLEPIDTVRRHLVARMDQHIQNQLPIDIDDPGDLEQALNALSQEINRDFLKVPSLKRGDEILAFGDTLFLTINKDTLEQNAHRLPPNIHLRGTLDELTVTEIPSE